MRGIPFRLTKRLESSRTAQILVPVMAILCALLLGGIILIAYGYSPLEIYREMFGGAFGSFYGLSETMVKGIPLMLTALAASVAFRMKLWNIGAEGQLYMGAFAATGIVLAWGGLQAWLIIPLMILAGFTAGALWGLIPGLLKAYWNINETIVTLMLNYIAILWTNYLLFGPWRDPKGFNFPMTAIFPSNASLPTLGNTRIHLGLFIALFLALLIWILVTRSKWGYEVRVIGESAGAARYSGMNIARNIIIVMLISGGIAGIAGMVEVAGVTHRMQQGLSSGYGFTGIIVAWLARLNPWVIIIVSYLFGGLLVGGYSVQTVGVPFSIVQMLQGLILFFLLGGEVFITNRLTWKTGRK